MRNLAEQIQIGIAIGIWTPGSKIKCKNSANTKRRFALLLLPLLRLCSLTHTATKRICRPHIHRHKCTHCSRRCFLHVCLFYPLLHIYLTLYALIALFIEWRENICNSLSLFLAALYFRAHALYTHTLIRTHTQTTTHTRKRFCINGGFHRNKIGHTLRAVNC